MVYNIFPDTMLGANVDTTFHTMSDFGVSAKKLVRSCDKNLFIDVIVNQVAFLVIQLRKCCLSVMGCLFYLPIFGPLPQQVSAGRIMS
jgi:hypothetical protein